MKQVYSEISHIMNAYPEQINAILSEYHHGHGSFAPNPYFIDFMLTNRGNETSHIVHVHINLSGTEHDYYETIHDPVPLRLIIEYDPKQDIVVVILVEPTSFPNKTRITISTIVAQNPNSTNFIENLFIPKNLRPIYNHELEQLARYLETDEIPQAI